MARPLNWSARAALSAALSLQLAACGDSASADVKADREAQTRLRSALATARLASVGAQGRFESRQGVPLTAASLERAASQIDFAAAGAAGVVGVRVDTDDTNSVSQPNSRILLWTMSTSGKWYGVRAVRGGATGYCEGAHAGAVDTADACKSTRWLGA